MPVSQLMPDVELVQLNQVKVMLSLETGMAHHFFGRVGAGKPYFDEAKALSGVWSFGVGLN